MSAAPLRLLTAWPAVGPLDALDAAWLAAHLAPRRAPEPDAPVGRAPEDLPAPAAGSGQRADDDEPEPEPESEPLPPTPAPERDQPAPERLLEEPEAGDEPGGDGGGLPTGGADLHMPRAKSAGSSGGGRGFAAPAAPALPHPLELARALRPLARRVPSRSRFVLDVAETVRRYATERLWVPVLRPARERWLRVALIIDSKGGAVVWRDTVREFRALLTGLGAFRHVRAWHLDTAAPKSVLSAVPGGPPRAPRELIDPTGRTLVIVLTSAVAAGWYTGAVRDALAPLAARGPVLLLPLLPERLWPRTALARAAPIDVTAPAAGCPNTTLRARRAGPFADEPPPPGLAVPVAVLDPVSLHRWADLVAGTPGATAPGFVLCDGPAPAPAADLSPSDRVRRFRAAASPEAQRFAGLLAAAPVLNLAVLRLVRAALCPECGQPHEAEVLTSGLLTRAEGDTDETDPRFDFVEGTRELLLDATPTDATLAVLGAVSDYLNARLPSGRTFRAVLRDPRSAEGELPTDGLIARVAAAVLTRAGGAYARLLRRTKRPVPKPLAPSVPVTFVLEALTWVPLTIGRTERTTFEVPANKPDAQDTKLVVKALELRAGHAVRVGRDASCCDWAIPDDDELSRLHATITWDGEKLTVARRAISAEYPAPPPNPIVFEMLASDRVVLRPGESFHIGRTEFRLCALERAPEQFPAPPAPVSAPVSPPPVPEPPAPVAPAPEPQPEPTEPIAGELEAITEVQPDPRRTHVQARQYGRRFALPPYKELRLGRDELKMDIAVPEDDQISRFQAYLRYDPLKATLTVTTRPPQPPYFPGPPADQTLVFDTVLKKLVEAPGGRCAVGRGESFWIGQTRFTLHTSGEVPLKSALDAEPAARHEERTRAQLEEIPFANPAAALRALEQLPPMLRAAFTEPALFRQLLKVAMDALPRADAAAIVRVPADASGDELQLNLVESNVRPKLQPSDGGFRPSRKLAHRAITNRRSAIHCWTADLDVGTISLDQYAITPWAICTPFQDGTRYALYIAGQAPGQWNDMGKGAQDKLVSDLTQYQKFAELIVGIMETTLRVSRLTQQNKVIRRAWPQGLWRFLDDPDTLEKMLAPKELEITPLMCDLREYALRTAQHTSDLVGAQQHVSIAHGVIGAAITDREGVVGGFRSDAVFGFWGWPKYSERQVELAARAALALVSRLNAGAPFGVVVTHGTAVAGRLGTHETPVVDAFGSVVNLAHRLERLRRVFGVPIVVSEEVARRLAQADPSGREFVTRRLGLVQAQGYPEPLWVYELTLPMSSGAMPDFMRHEWDAAVTDFTDGNWADAYERLIGVFDEDPAAKCLLGVMDRFGRKRPADWTGSFTPIGPPGSDT